MLKFSNDDTAYIFKYGTEEKIQMPFEINDFEYQIKEVINCINSEKIQSDFMGWKDRIEVMEIMDSVRN